MTRGPSFALRCLGLRSVATVTDIKNIEGVSKVVGHSQRLVAQHKTLNCNTPPTNYYASLQQNNLAGILQSVMRLLKSIRISLLTEDVIFCFWARSFIFVRADHFSLRVGYMAEWSLHMLRPFDGCVIRMLVMAATSSRHLTLVTPPSVGLTYHIAYHQPLGSTF